MEADRSVTDRISNIMHLEQGTINALKLCTEAVRRGGTVSVVGVYATPYADFPWHQIFDKGLTIKAGQAPVQKYIDDLLKLIEDGKIRTDDIITHNLPLDEASHAYKIFCEKEDNCVKVVLKPFA
jgi:S-(hydroxymethyl)glutathione dehydrogenase / alcohol dehydrogenase